MKLKGLAELQKHVPEFRTTKGISIAILFLAVVIFLTTLFFILVDTKFSEWLPDGEIIILALGLLILSRFFSQKRYYQQKYGELAYRYAFTRFIIPGLGIVIASIAHLGYITGPEIPAIWWRPILAIVGWILVVIGLILWFRSIAVFGVDNLTMLYVYFPRESSMADSSIYQILRHPIYSAALDLGIGLSFIHTNWYGLVVALILPIFMTGWVRLVEEKELVERFPDYGEYRKHTPAIWVKPQELVEFYRFLILGE